MTVFGYVQRMPYKPIYDVYTSPDAARWRGTHRHGRPIGEVVKVKGKWSATLTHEPDFAGSWAKSRDQAVINVSEELAGRAEAAA